MTDERKITDENGTVLDENKHHSGDIPNKDIKEEALKHYTFTD